MSISPPKRLGDDFISPIGYWENYDQYNPDDREHLEHLKVITLRSLVSQDEVVPEQILGLSSLTMDYLSTKHVQEIGIANVVVHNENWTGGVSITSSPYYHYQTLLQKTLSTGSNVIESLMVNSPIDITVDIGKNPFVDGGQGGTRLGTWNLGGRYLGVGDSGSSLGTWIIGDGSLGTDDDQNYDRYSILCLVVPDLPAIVNAASYVELTSSTDGTFGTTNTARVYLTPERIVGTGENTQFRIIVNDFQNTDFDPRAVTGIRLVLNVTSISNFKMLAAYVAPNGTNIDSNIRIDSLRKRVYKSPNARSNTSYPEDFNPYSITVPTMWRSAGISGDGDPKPYDVEFGMSFYTGSMVRGGNITFYARENTLDPVTMVDLDATRMSALDGRDIPQYAPDAGYLPRTQDQLDIYTQSALNQEDQIDLSRTPDGDLGARALFQVKWTNSNYSITAGSAESTGYTYTDSSELDPFTNYIFYVSLEGNKARVLLYESDVSGTLNTLVHDSGYIEDDNIWPRVRGRVGWSADLQDGDAYFASIKDRKAVFGEYQSRPMRSTTPVDGAQLYAQFTPKTEHFTGFDAGPINIDSTLITREGTAWKISSIGNLGFQGIQSNSFQLFDLANSTISFDFKLDDSGSIDVKDIKVFLVDQYGANYNQIATTPLRAGEWQTVTGVVPSGFEFSTGVYRLVIVQSSVAAGVWYVDNVSVSTRSVIWSARPEPSSPFDTDSSPWAPFNDMIGDGRSVQFADRGNALQVRGQVLRQDGEISKIQIVPKYSELGRILEPA